MRVKGSPAEAQAWPQATVPPPGAPLARPQAQAASPSIPVYPLQGLTAPGAGGGGGATQAETAPLSPQTGPACSLLLSGSRSQPLCLPCSFQTWASYTQDGNLRSDRGLLVEGSSESRTDLGREHSQTALFTGQVLSRHPSRCKDAFRCTLTSNGPPNCWPSRISSTSAQYYSQRC